MDTGSNKPAFSTPQAPTAQPDTSLPQPPPPPPQPPIPNTPPQPTNPPPQPSPPSDPPPPTHPEQLSPPDVPPELPPGGKKVSLNYKMLGLVLFLFATAGGLAYYLTLYKTPSTTPSAIVVATPSPIPLFLEINSPKDGESAVNGEILVSGNTLPETTVVIYSDSDDTSVDSDANGKFEGTVVIGSEDSLLRITAYGDNGEEKTITINVKSEPET